MLDNMNHSKSNNKNLVVLKEITALDNYLESYPFAGYAYGHYGMTGDSSYSMFSNHGCDPNKRHIGDLVDYYFDDGNNESNIIKEEEQQVIRNDDSNFLIPFFYTMSHPNDISVFNPLMDRRYTREETSEGFIQKLNAGEEIFCDYTSFAGTDPDELEYNKQELYDQCYNHQIGRVVQVDYIENNR